MLFIHFISHRMNCSLCCFWISATDLASHFKVFEEQQKLLVEFQKHKEDQRRLLLCLFMTACDLSDQTKDWSVARQTAVSISKNWQIGPWWCISSRCDAYLLSRCTECIVNKTDIARRQGNHRSLDRACQGTSG
jgi:hypothetical protein